MVFAIAALLFQIGPALPAVPAAAASAASSASSAVSAKAAPSPAPARADLPEAPLPSTIARSVAPVAEPATTTGVSSTSERKPFAVRTAALDAAKDPANDPQTLSTIHIPESNSKPLQRISVEAVPSYRKWLVLSIAQSTAAGFDAYATRRAISNGAYEADPMMRPFSHSSGIYAAIQVAPLVLDYTAKHMQHSESPFVRHTWWLPQVAGTGLYLFSGAHDMRITSRR